MTEPDSIQRTIRAYAAAWAARDRSIQIDPREIFVVGREAVMVWTINGVVEGGPISVDGVDVFTFDKDARITSVRAYWDREAMLAQRKAAARGLQTR